jgi:hypothetical protein
MVGNASAHEGEGWRNAKPSQPFEQQGKEMNTMQISYQLSRDLGSLVCKQPNDYRHQIVVPGHTPLEGKGAKKTE